MMGNSNYEHYKKEIDNILSKGYIPSIRKGKLAYCTKELCSECAFAGKDKACFLRLRDWLLSEYDCEKAIVLEVSPAVKHMLGINDWKIFEKYGKRHVHSYRNYYSIGPKGEPYFERLVEAGFAVANRNKRGINYHLTESGFAWVEDALNITIHNEDRIQTEKGKDLTKEEIFAIEEIWKWVKKNNIFSEKFTEELDVANDLLADSIIGYMPESDTHIVSDMDHIIDALNPELSEIYGIESMETFYEEALEAIPAEDIEFFTFKYGRDVSTIVANKGSKYNKLAKATHKWINGHFDELDKDEQDYINGCDYDAVVDLFASCDSVDEIKQYIAEYKEEA